jgi:hypothetical protein
MQDFTFSKALGRKLYRNKGTSEAGHSPPCAHFLVKPGAMSFTYDIESMEEPHVLQKG